MLQLGFLDLTMNQWSLVGWIFGALFALMVPFYLKVRAGTLTWSDFNFGFILNFIITLVTGVAFSLVVFSTWVLPVGSWFIVLVISFLTAAGFDKELIERILNAIGLYDALKDNWKG